MMAVHARVSRPDVVGVFDGGAEQGSCWTVTVRAMLCFAAAMAFFMLLREPSVVEEAAVEESAVEAPAEG